MGENVERAIINDYKMKLPVDMIIKKYGITKHELYHILDNYGIERRKEFKKNAKVCPNCGQVIIPKNATYCFNCGSVVLSNKDIILNNLNTISTFITYIPKDLESNYYELVKTVIDYINKEK